jgi:prepilin-type N-terminal cleavage/methylation domain-containing protein
MDQSVKRRVSRCQAGMTLPEVLITMIVLAIVSTMLIGGWISLQRAYASTRATNTARAASRDALDRISSELRECQPPNLISGQALFTRTDPNEADFYSSYNQPGASTDGTGIGVLHRTRIYLDTATRTLYWQRDTNGNYDLGALWNDPNDRKLVLAKNVVNAIVPDTTVTPNSASTAIFTYGYRDASGTYHADYSKGGTDPATIVSVRVRLITDTNPLRTPDHIVLTTTLRPRNAAF